MIRTWMKHLSELIHGFDFIAAEPKGDFLIERPDHCLDVALVTPRGDCAVYVVDERELSEAGCDDEISGRVKLPLPEGEYEISLYSPLTGESTPAGRGSGPEAEIAVGPFRHDLVICARRLGG